MRPAPADRSRSPRLWRRARGRAPRPSRPPAARCRARSSTACQQQLHERCGASFEVGRPVRLAGLDALEHQAVEEREERRASPRRRRATTEARRSATPWARMNRPAPTSRSRRAASISRTPGSRSASAHAWTRVTLARRPVVFIDRLDVEPDRDREPLGGRRRRREPGGQLVEAPRRRASHVARNSSSLPGNRCRSRRPTARSRERRPRSWRCGSPSRRTRGRRPRRSGRGPPARGRR